ncbi:MAG: beta-lactamase family protein [Jiangellaceae bacterium]|nr:beta-lactamase family protein [Jiangellaceae bacterium]
MGSARRFCAVAVLVVLTACTAVGDADDPPRRDDDRGRVARSDAALAATILDGEPGCSGAVGVEGDVVWTGSVGLADLASGALLSADTVFEIGQVSNQFTATLVLSLVQAGDVRLDDPVAAYLDGLPGWAADITVDDLVHHTSGLPDYVDLLRERGFRPEDVTTQADALKAVAAANELQFEPGFKFEYSASNYLLLAEIVRAVTGSPLPAVMERMIFEPLDLDMTMDPAAEIADKAVSYTATLGGGHDAVDWAWQQVGDGGINTTPAELVRWADNYRTGRLGGSRLQYAQLAGAAHTSLSDSGRAFAERYGAGIFIGRDGGLFHRGAWEGFVTALKITPDRRVAAAVACNVDNRVPSATATILALIWS